MYLRNLRRRNRGRNPAQGVRRLQRMHQRRQPASNIRLRDMQHASVYPNNNAHRLFAQQNESNEIDTQEYFKRIHAYVNPLQGQDSKLMNFNKTKAKLITTKRTRQKVGIVITFKHKPQNRKSKSYGKMTIKIDKKGNFSATVNKKFDLKNRKLVESMTECFIRGYPNYPDGVKNIKFEIFQHNPIETNMFIYDKLINMGIHHQNIKIPKDVLQKLQQRREPEPQQQVEMEDGQAEEAADLAQQQQRHARRQRRNPSAMFHAAGNGNGGVPEQPEAGQDGDAVDGHAPLRNE